MTETGKKSIGVGIIGTGFIGPVHIEGLRRNGIDVVAVCDGEKEAKAAAEAWNIPEVYTNFDYKALMASPNVDVVHIASPNRFHHEQSLAALEAGKHVICEKPLAMNSQETAEILAKAEASDRLFAVDYNVRFYPANLQMRAMVESGELGEIIHVNGYYMQDWLHKVTDYNWRLLAEEGGSLRSVGDIGTHWMDLVSFILGQRIESVMATLGTYHKTRKRPPGEVATFARDLDTSDWLDYDVDTDDFSSIVMRFANGTIGNLATSQVAAGRKNCIKVEIYGSKKSVWWCSEDPNYLNVGSRDEPNQRVMRNSGFEHEAVLPYMDYPGGHNEGFPDTFKMMFRNFYGKLRGEDIQRYYANALDGHHEILVCEAIEKSAKEQRWIDVEA
ncbi:MAG: Gfo/Idh/MocA family protein [Puniceicoccaceae bacterium]